MSKLIKMQDPTGAIATAYIGINLPTLLFGPLPALFRGHLSAFAVMLAVGLGGVYVIDQEFGEQYGTIVAMVLWAVYAVTYNSWHRSWLISRGYKPVAEADVAVEPSGTTYMREDGSGQYSELRNS